MHIAKVVTAAGLPMWVFQLEGKLGVSAPAS